MSGMSLTSASGEWSINITPPSIDTVSPPLNSYSSPFSSLTLQPSLHGTSACFSESMVISINQEGAIDCVMAEAPHGTAPSLEGKNVANPMAMILAAAGLLGFMDEKELKTASRAIYEATLEAVYDGVRTADLSGTAQTDQFTNEVIRRVRGKLEVWSALA